MNKMFCTIRKWDYRGNKRYNPSRKNLNKQIHTLHRKLKKTDKVITSYSVEKDKGKNQYHIHSLIYYEDEEKLKDRLGTFIGGEIVERKNGFDSYLGKYGTIWLERVNNETDIYRYINKYEISKTLV